MRRKILLVSSVVIIVILGTSIIRIALNETPEKEIYQARKTLTEAEFASSPRFAKEAYQEAKKYYDSAMLEWSLENKKFILFRDYQATRELADKAVISSENAIAHTREIVTRTKDNLENRINILGNRIRNFEENFGNLPISTTHQKEIARCKLEYTEAIMAYKNKNYPRCKSKLDAVELTANKVFVPYIEMLMAYAESYPEWKEMVDQTITHSKKNSTYALIVDKIARELRVYKNGEMLHHFQVELGVNWIGDKQQQGDKSTPEGFYKIVDKKSNGQTNYYKALLLDYPNEKDKEQFALHRKQGIIRANAKIGSHIEIHGNGGKGFDWTDGCIALKNTEMERIFKLCPLGTRVTIVGSASPLDNYFQ